MDKQPWGDGWDEDKGPTEPVIQNGKLYGRGGADDGYGMYSALLAIKACQDNGLSHPRVYIFIEGAEESSKEDLEYYIAQFDGSKIKHKLDLIIALDADTLNNKTFSSITNLRGFIKFDLKVEAFKDNIHSGNSGIFADTFTVSTDLISRLEDKNTYLMKDEFQVEIPQHRLDEIRVVAKLNRSSDHLPALHGIGSIPTLTTQDEDEIAIQQHINVEWKSVLSVIGASGLPD